MRLRDGTVSLCHHYQTWVVLTLTATATRVGRMQVADPRAAAAAWIKKRKRRVDNQGHEVLAKRTQPSQMPGCISGASPVGGYGQCGGKNYVGSCTCIAGWECVYSGEYYSECQPAESSCANSFYSQCGGLGFNGATCCPDGSACVDSSEYYSQCIPGAATTTTVPPSSSSSSAPSTTSSLAPTPTCNAFSGGSDGCTPYAVDGDGVTLPGGETFQDNGHVNYQAISCSDYTPGQSYLNPGSDWSPESFGVHFEAKASSPGYAYIGASTFEFSGASTAFNGSYCITWVQLDSYNQHFGEGGQEPVCSSQCGG